ncbi:hypothetical protein NC651_009585 [Populus alba x Populus x berolinensis]|nr:hypothetical protein NC651_009585 [Populus alba x Populus x berolinensis]
MGKWSGCFGWFLEKKKSKPGQKQSPGKGGEFRWWCGRFGRRLWGKRNSSGGCCSGQLRWKKMVGPAAVLEKKSGGGGGFWFVPLAERAGLEKSKPKVGRLCLQRRWETAGSKMHRVGAAALGRLF